MKNKTTLYSTKCQKKSSKESCRIHFVVEHYINGLFKREMASGVSTKMCPHTSSKMIYKTMEHCTY